MKDMYDVVIVGAGPAGLAAALSCKLGNLKYKIFDQGRKIERRSHVDVLGSGVGGAGLYSDGKLSFYPSATNLWRLKPQDTLAASYNAIKILLQNHGVHTPAFPADGQAQSELTGRIITKKFYKSIYLSFQTRLSIISELQQTIQDSLVCGAEFVELDRKAYYTVRFRDVGTMRQFSINSRCIVFASGKMGPLLILRDRNIARIFRRIEAGVRIQQRAADFFLSKESQLDPKYILTDAKTKVEWRTFCCCRRGEIIEIDYDGIRLVSGRADVTPTDYSNVGFLSRITISNLKTWCQLESQLRQNRRHQVTSLGEFLRCEEPLGTKVGGALGETFSSLTRRGIRLLVDSIGEERFGDAELFAPAIEGIGFYPDVEANLKVGGHMIWVAGDAVGAFRGLLGALVSGYFVGSEVTKAIR